MSINTHSLALLGIGYGSFAVATHGFLVTVDIDIKPVSDKQVSKILKGGGSVIAPPISNITKKKNNQNFFLVSIIVKFLDKEYKKEFIVNNIKPNIISSLIDISTQPIKVFAKEIGVDENKLDIKVKNISVETSNVEIKPR